MKLIAPNNDFNFSLYVQKFLSMVRERSLQFENHLFEALDWIYFVQSDRLMTNVTFMRTLQYSTWIKLGSLIHDTQDWFQFRFLTIGRMWHTNAGL